MDESTERSADAAGPQGAPTPKGGAPYREVTLSAIIFGIVVGVIMNAAITYSGLKIGFTIVGSSIAAVLGFGVLRGILRRGSITEVNIGQTIGSAVNTPNSGIIFTVPVLVLLGRSFGFGDANFWWLALAGTAGAILGGAFIIPLRKQMIDVDRLRFPTGTAVAAILKSPGAGARKSVVLVAGIALAMLIYLPAGLPQIKFDARVERLDDLVASGEITQEQADQTRRIAGWIESETIPQDVVDRGERQAQRIEAGDLERADADPVALTAYRISQGQAEWSDLRSRAWAQWSLPGYGELGWRLPERRDESGELPDKVDHDGDGRPDLVLENERFHLGRLLGIPDEVALTFAIAPFALGAGYLSGMAGLLVLAGGVLAYLVLNPILFNAGMMPATLPGHEVATWARDELNRPLGIGLLLGGALMGIVASLPAVREAVKSISAASKAKSGSDELGLKTLLIAAAAAFVLLFVASSFVIGSESEIAGGLLSGLPAVLRNLVIALVGAVWIWFAGIIIAQCTGMTDWSPISGIALLTVVLVLFLAGKNEVNAAVLLGAALCVAITCAADMMADLKTGYLVGGTPKRQQTVELIFTGIGPVISMATIVLIVAANQEKFGVGLGDGTDTTAPQAQALKAVIEGVQGEQMPYTLYGLGAVLGAALGLGSFAGLGVLIGLSMYLPFAFILTYGVGCIVNIGVIRWKGRGWSEEWGVPLAAGFIVGEAILALVISAVVLILAGG